MPWVTGIAHITVGTPERRLDVALPDDVTVAELVPVLVGAGGAALAEHGAAHAGWSLRHPDGRSLSAARTLRDQGVRDGDVLCLVTADTEWPPPAYDDLADGVTELSVRGTAWDSGTTAWLTGACGTAATLTGCLLLLRAGTPSTAAVLIAALFAAAGLAGCAIAARGYRNTAVAAWAGSLGAIYAAAGAFRAASPGAQPGARVTGGAHAHTLGSRSGVGAGPGSAAGSGSPEHITHAVLAGGSVLAIASVIALAITGRASVTLIAGMMAGVLVAAGTGVAAEFHTSSGAALVVGLVTIGGRAFHPVARRISGTGPGAVDSGPFDPDRLAAAIARADTIATGLWCGAALAGLGAAMVITTVGGTAGPALIAAAVVACGLRARTYRAFRQRAAATVATAALALPIGYAAVTGPGLSGGTALGAAAALGIAGTLVAATATRRADGRAGAGTRFRAGGAPVSGTAAPKMIEALEVLAAAGVVALALTAGGFCSWVASLIS